MTSLPSAPTLRHYVPKTKRRPKMGSSMEDILFGDSPNPTRAEQAIWRAVIMQCFTDAISRSAKREAIQHRREALTWLTNFSRDFRTVCEYAGYDPVYVQERIRALLHEHARRDAERLLPHVPEVIETKSALPTSFSSNYSHISMRCNLKGLGARL